MYIRNNHLTTLTTVSSVYCCQQSCMQMFSSTRLLKPIIVAHKSCFSCFISAYAWVFFITLTWHAAHWEWSCSRIDGNHPQDHWQPTSLQQQVRFFIAVFDLAVIAVAGVTDGGRLGLLLKTGQKIWDQSLGVNGLKGWWPPGFSN